MEAFRQFAQLAPASDLGSTGKLSSSGTVAATIN
jgi:hypothetical protein